MRLIIDQMIKALNEDVAQNLEAHLKLIKTSTDLDKDEELYNLMIKAKEVFGELERRMAPFYRYYGVYTLEKIRRNTEIFGGPAQKAMNEMNENEESGQPEIVQGEEEKQEGSKSESGDNNVVDQPKDPNQPEITTEKENFKEGDEGEREGEGEGEQENDDEEVCYLNLEVAKKILVEHFAKHKETVNYSPEEVERLKYEICEVKIDLGDFFIQKEDNERAITQYQEALEIRSEVEGAERDRMLAELHYLIGLAYLGENGKQEKAFTYMLKAVEILINHLEFISQIKIQERPTEKKPNVNRLEYLPTMMDTPEVKDLKEALLPLLDKIEDLEMEILQMGEFDKAREQDKKLTQQVQNTFGAPTIPTTTPVISLGTFGNTSAGAGNSLIRIKPKTNTVPSTVLPTSTPATVPTTQTLSPSKNDPQTNTNDVQTDYDKQKLNEPKPEQKQ